MFFSLLNFRINYKWTIFHIVLGWISTISPFVLVGWFYLILLVHIIPAILQYKQGRPFQFIALLFYLISFEMLVRMTKVAPFIPTELGKYFLIGFMSLGIFLRGMRSYGGFVMVLLLIPSLFFDFSGQRNFQDIIFNFFGPIAIGLGLTCLYRTSVTLNQIQQILRLIWLTSLAALVFTFIKTPDLETIDFNLKAEFATTADTSSNQVSTILGVGMFLSFYSVLNRLRFSGSTWSDIAIFIAFGFQGLLSFSRGGMLISVFSICILLFYQFRESSPRLRQRVALGGLFIIVALYFVFNFTNQITNGNLLLRYSGETQGTLLGSKEKTTNVIVSGRVTILEDDFDLFLKYPVLGVGAASSRYLRNNTYLVSPHIEFTRLLAEHGFLGFFYFIILIGLFYRSKQLNRLKQEDGLLLALFSLAILTSFHAAIRTYVTPVFILLSCFSVQNPTIKTKIVS